MDFNDLDKRLWYVRWFFWSQDVWLAFSRKKWKREGVQSKTALQGTNLCYAVRVMFVWAPLALAANAIAYFLLIASVTWVPIRMFGLTGYVTSSAVVAAIAGAAVLLDYLIENNAEAFEAKAERIEERLTASYRGAAARVQGPGFHRIVWQYIVALKRRICPIITFQRQN